MRQTTKNKRLKLSKCNVFINYPLHAFFKVFGYHDYLKDEKDKVKLKLSEQAEEKREKFLDIAEIAKLF